MIFLIAKVLSIVFREKPVVLLPGVKYLATLDMKKVKPGTPESDVKNYLMKMGFTPTTSPNKWKAHEKHLSRLPTAAVLKAEKL